MQTFLNIVKDYWGVLILLIGALVFLVTQGKAKAGQIILSLMLQAEKNAEAFVLQTGEDKFDFVVSQGYNLLPKIVKMTISYNMFEALADKLYAAAKQYLLSLQGADPKPQDQQIQENKETKPG